MSNGVTNGSNGRRAVITKETLLPLGIAVVLVLAAMQLGRTWGAVDATVETTRTGLEMLRARVESVERSTGVCATKSELRQLEIITAEDVKMLREALIKGGMQP